ncbi:MAG: hypothetical protein GEU99_18970 [Luteitalea sp.]|nr:hypothetical protein [Luteitalea sp.]
MMIHGIVAAALAVWQAMSTAAPRPLVIAARPDNDLYEAILAADGAVARYDTAEEAIAQAPQNAAVLLLADEYPERTLSLTDSHLARATAKKLRLYIEYPSSVPGLKFGPPRSVEHERVVVTSDVLAPQLPRLAILSVHQAKFIPVEAVAGDLALAHVAGFETAVYGLPRDGVYPLLFRHPHAAALVATTKLSQFVTARYAPPEAWDSVWKHILAWLTESDNPPELAWKPSVRPSFGPDETLPADAEKQAIRRSMDWFAAARLLIDPSWQHKVDQAAGKERVGPGPRAHWRAGDGSDGVLEGFSSNIQPDGSQWVRWDRRSDCIGEVAGAYALAGRLSDDTRYATSARKLLDFLYFNSSLAGGPRGDPKSPSFGLLGWFLPTGTSVYYGDDNARALLGTMLAAAALGSDRWDDALLRSLLANLRTTGRLGFRGNRIEEDDLQEHGWPHYFESDRVHYAPHYEAYAWAAYLWAYKRTGYELFLERARQAISMTMEAYPDRWRWQNGIQQERARMLLPLAWLVRLEDTPEHRAWLQLIARDLLALQDESGAIREAVGSAEQGHYAPPKTNEEYGKSEAPLIQKNGDPVTDLLYTSNFAFLGLHEAAAATGEASYREAADRLAQYLCRIQVSSERHPELDGAWFRAFDFGRWAYWASNADHGWGAWSIETGWTQGWITAVLALRQMSTSVWDITAESRVAANAERLITEMMSARGVGEGKGRR